MLFRHRVETHSSALQQTSWPKEWNWWARTDLHLKGKEKKAQAGTDSSNFPENPHMLSGDEKAATPHTRGKE